MDVVAIQMMYTQVMQSLRTLRDEEAGQGLVEYALILFLVSIAAVIALGFLAGGISGVFNTVTKELGGVIE